MKPQVQFPHVSLSLLLISIFFSTSNAKTMIEPCISSDSCPSLLSYILPSDSKLSEIAYRFNVTISDIIAANSINSSTVPSLSTPIFPAKSLVKIPISCPCVDGIRRSISTMYTVRAADTVDSISEGYGRLVSAEQIRSINSISSMNPLTSGQVLVIPLPCTCLNNSNNGVAAVYLSYVVQIGDNLGTIAMEFGTTVIDLEAVNGLVQPLVAPDEILAIPIPACSSTNLNWYNESLMVPTGTYALTANNCIKCICQPGSLSLQCVPSGLVGSCSHLQCKNSDLFIGDAYVTHTAIGCNTTACLYRGHHGRKIFRSLVNSSHVQCPGNQSYTAMSPTAHSSSNPVFPSIIFPPLSSPFSAPYPATAIDGSHPNRNEQNSNSSSVQKFLSKVSFYGLLFLEFLFCL